MDDTSDNKKKSNKLKKKTSAPSDCAAAATTVPDKYSDVDPCPPLIEYSLNGESKVNLEEAQLSKRLANVVLTSPKNSSTLAASKPLKKSKEDYKFWKTQPVPDMTETITVNEPFESDIPISDIRTDCYSLPTGFFWQELDIMDDLKLDELYNLLNENYVEDDDHLFRFAYAKEFLKWTLQPPGWRPEWLLGVRVERNSKLVGFIAGMPMEMKVHGIVRMMVDINFLCVHKRLRDKRMAPVLIREITRRVNLHGIFQAVYTSGVILPRPVASCRYWHRPLNSRKLLDVGFSHLSRTMTLQRSVKLYRLPDDTSLTGFRQLRSKDLPAARELLMNYLSNFKLHPLFSESEFEHWFLPKSGIVHTYVVESAPNVITDFCSFYSLPSSVMQNPKYSTLNAAYSFYNVSTKTPWPVLMKEALIQAKKLGFDVFNALDLMDNKSFMEELKFGIGDGNLYYYIYNWRCPSLNPEEVGIVLQ